MLRALLVFWRGFVAVAITITGTVTVTLSPAVASASAVVCVVAPSAKVIAVTESVFEGATSSAWFRSAVLAAVAYFSAFVALALESWSVLLVEASGLAGSVATVFRSVGVAQW